MGSDYLRYFKALPSVLMVLKQFIMLIIQLFRMFQKVPLIEWAIPMFAGPICLDNDRCEKILTAVIGNGFCASNSHLSYHSASSPVI